MASSRYLFTLDLHTTYSQITLPVTAGDTDRELVMCFSDGDRPYLLTESSTVSISFEYPGGATTISYGCVVDLENNAAHFEFDENTCASAGVYTVQVRLTDGATNRVVAAPKFELEASGIITGTDAPEISPGDQIILDQIFGQEAIRQKQELDRKDAEGKRVVNENARIENETKRVSLYNEIYGKLERGELKGEKGIDGVSPILTPVKKDYGYDVTIKDKEATKTFSLFNGKDGERGVDGTSVTHTWGGIDNTVLYITSASGTSSADLKGAKGDKGDRGEGIDIVKSYPSIAAMMSAYATDGVPVGKFVVISTGNVDDEENARLYVKTETEYMYLTDLSGAQGIRGEKGETGNGIQRAEVNANSELVITYTDGTVRNLGSIKGEKGDQGEPQETIQVYVEPSYTMDIVLNALQNAGRNISVFNRVKLSGYISSEVEIKFRHMYDNTYFVESVIVDKLGICIPDQFDVTTKPVGAFFYNNYSLQEINTEIKHWHGLNEVKGLWALNYSITKAGSIGRFGVNFTSYDPMNIGENYKGVSFGSAGFNQLTYTRNGPSVTVYSFDEERWYDDRFRFINVLEEPDISDLDADVFVNWLYENGTKLPNEYQLKEDLSLETFNKDVVGAINEVNGKTLDKALQFNTFAQDDSGVGFGEHGVYWGNSLYIETEAEDIETDYYARVPIVAGEGISFEVDQENQVVKINAEEGSEGYDDSTIGIWIFNETLSFDGVEYDVEFPINFTSLGKTESLDYVLFATNRYNTSGNFLAFGDLESYSSTVAYASVVAAWLSVGWQDKRHRTIAIQDELEDGWFKTWLKANAKKYVGYQRKYDSALDTDSKDIVGAINEIAEKTIDKISYIGFGSGDYYSVHSSDNGISWDCDEFEIETQKSNGSVDYHRSALSNRVPIVAGDNVTFTVDEENQVVKINSTGGGAELPTVTTDDNGKFLRVVGGSWATALVPNAEGATF